MEVIRGSVGSIYGPGALGGVVNLVTRSAGDAGPEVQASLQGGSFETFQTDVTGPVPVSNRSILATVTGLSTQGDFTYQQPFTGQDLTQVNNDASQLGALAHYESLWSFGRIDAVADVEQLQRGLAGSVEDPDSTERLSQGRQSATVRLQRDGLGGAMEARVFGMHEETDVAGNVGDPGLQQDVGGGVQGLGRWQLGSNALSGVLSAGAEQVSSTRISTGRPELGLGASDEWLLAGGRVSLLPAARAEISWAASAPSPPRSGPRCDLWSGWSSRGRWAGASGRRRWMSSTWIRGWWPQTPSSSRRQPPPPTSERR